MKKISTVIQRPVLETAPYVLADVIALQAIANGTADSIQQKRGLTWIVNKASGIHSISYRDGGTEAERATCFSEGRKFVAHQINALLTMNARIMKEDN